MSSSLCGLITPTKVGSKLREFSQSVQAKTSALVGSQSGYAELDTPTNTQTHTHIHMYTYPTPPYVKIRNNGVVDFPTFFF